MCLLSFISPLGVIDHCMVFLLLITILKGCVDSMSVVPIPPIVEDPRKVFDNMPECNVVLLSDMIARYALNGKDEEAIVSYFGRGGLDTNTIRNETHDKKISGIVLNSYYSLVFNIIYKCACKTIRKLIKVKGNIFSAPPVYFPWFLCLPIYLKWSLFLNKKANELVLFSLVFHWIALVLLHS